MRRLLLVVAILGLAACSSGGSKASSASTSASPTTTTPNEQGAEAALKVQFQQLSDGQFGLMYQTLHPAEQAILTKDQFVACYEKDAPRGTISDVKVKTHYDETTAIPGTQEHADSTALTTSYKLNGASSTTTFHEIDVDGSWRWTYNGITDCLAGT